MKCDVKAPLAADERLAYLMHRLASADFREHFHRRDAARYRRGMLYISLGLTQDRDKALPGIGLAA